MSSILLKKTYYSKQTRTPRKRNQTPFILCTDKCHLWVIGETGWLEIADDVSEWLNQPRQAVTTLGFGFLRRSTTYIPVGAPILDLSIQRSIFNRR